MLSRKSVAARLGKDALPWNEAAACGAPRKAPSPPPATGWPGRATGSRCRKRQLSQSPGRAQRMQSAFSCTSFNGDLCEQQIKLKFLLLTFKALEDCFQVSFMNSGPTVALRGFEGMELWTLGLRRALKGLYIFPYAAPRQRESSLILKCFHFPGPLGTSGSFYIWVF